MKIRPVHAADAARISEIYNHYIHNSVFTFEEEFVSVGQMQQRIERVSPNYPWLKLEQDHVIQGYAYADAWKPRGAYRHTVETTIYLHPDAAGQGFGKPLYQALADELRSREFHCAMASIALPNAPSIKVHEAIGFIKIGHAHDIGRKFDDWVDVGYWQLLL
jgi:L-amino acid N-acyltransferase YncA